MDLRSLAEKVDLEEAEYQEMLDLFLQTASHHLIQLETAIEAEDTRKIIESAHSIKGSAAALGLTAISGIAGGIEANARADRIRGAEEAVHTIKTEMERVSELVSACSIRR